MRQRFITQIGQAALLILLNAHSACTRESVNPWAVVAIRAPREGEVPFEESSGYLWPSEHANDVPGPDSLVAHSRSDEQHGTYLEVEDQRTGEVVRVLDHGGSLPHWSPDGQFISCVIWKSARQPHELAVVDVKSRRLLVDPDVSASGTTMKWSPDSRTLAAAGVIYGQPRGILYTISIPSGAIRVLDSLAVLSDYEFSWSPDGRWIAYSRPTELDPVSEEPVASDLWIADASTGDAWKIVESPDKVESNPLWVTNNAIQFEQASGPAADSGVTERRILELRLDGTRASP